MIQSTQLARGLCDNLPLTGISCSLNRCHADLPPSCCSFAMDFFSDYPWTRRFWDPDIAGPPTAYPAIMLRNWATPVAPGQKTSLGPGSSKFQPQKHQRPISASASTKSGPRAWATWASWFFWEPKFVDVQNFQIGLIG